MRTLPQRRVLDTTGVVSRASVSPWRPSLHWGTWYHLAVPRARRAGRTGSIRSKIRCGSGFPGKPDLDTILGLFPRTTGEPAFDPDEIAAKAKSLRTSPEVNTGHPFLDLSVRTGLAHIDATFEGDHPKYGVGVYDRPEHDGFPPTIIAAIDALSAWGLNERAAQAVSLLADDFRPGRREHRLLRPVDQRVWTVVAHGPIA